MNLTLNQQLPILVAAEKAALLTSILNMLRQNGFVVFLQEKIPVFAEQTQRGGREVKVLDGLNLLRYVTQNWPKDMPVVILQEFEGASVQPIAALAA